MATETSVPDERRSQSRRRRAGLRDGARPGYFDDRDVLGLVPVAVAPTMPGRGLTRVEGMFRLVALDGKARVFRWRHRGQRFAYAVAVVAVMFSSARCCPPITA